LDRSKAPSCTGTQSGGNRKVIVLSYQIDWNIRWIVLAVRKSIGMSGDKLLDKEQDVREQSCGELVADQIGSIRIADKEDDWSRRLDPDKLVETLNKLQS